ncbi:hypothetical protein [Natronohydrobacter thiooxidans]|uniref:hypothetical protein n=1 Tax=Natronohydrobacter thiooxidans TaxID=87172 RepID=UPI001587B38D|nr:hypothetical protein [Natronohydrobacter thiooxidans]
MREVPDTEPRSMAKPADDPGIKRVDVLQLERFLAVLQRATQAQDGKIITFPARSADGK